MNELRPRRLRGMVLPTTLLLLLGAAFAGLWAARQAAQFEQFSNNLRTTHIARHAAEKGLHHCEQVVVDRADHDSQTHGIGLTGRVQVPEAPATDVDNGQWNRLANWADTYPNRIPWPTTEQVSPGKAAPSTDGSAACMAELLSEDRVVVTARGLSPDARLDAQGRLTSGADVWLQSILTAADIRHPTPASSAAPATDGTDSTGDPAPAPSGCPTVTERLRADGSVDPSARPDCATVWMHSHYPLVRPPR